jgi:hypothetical protein
MRYLIAFLIFVSVWFGGTLIVWITTGLFSSIRYDEGIMVGWGSDWRNRSSTIVSVVVAACLATLYLRRARKKGHDTPNA